MVCMPLGILADCEAWNDLPVRILARDLLSDRDSLCRKGLRGCQEDMAQRNRERVGRWT